MAKILCFDIETNGVVALKSDLGFVIVFGYKFLGDKKARSISISKKDLRTFNDKPLLEAASKLLEEADIVVGHFASVFDRRFINGRLMIHGLPPLPATRMRDTCMIARSVANYSSNRLKHLAKILGLKHQKLDNGWPQQWHKIMAGDMKALKEMAHYCEGDVQALEELYLKLRPYDNAHPRIVEDRSKCGSCGGGVQYRGTANIRGNVFRRYQCSKCGKWGRDEKKVKNG